MAATQEEFDLSPVPQSRCDSHGVLTEVNAAFARLVGLPATDLTGRPVRDLCHRTDPGEADAALEALLTGRRPIAQTQRILRRRDGRPVPTLVSVTPVHEGEGTPV